MQYNNSVTKELAQDVHQQLLRTFKRNGKRGYCWMLAQFGSSDLGSMSEQEGRWLLKCLQAKELGNRCPFHHRAHDLI